MALLGSIGFLSPWLLWALAALPVLWWLLRAVPPAPLRIRFPAVTLLLGLKDEEAAGPGRGPGASAGRAGLQLGQRAGLGRPADAADLDPARGAARRASDDGRFVVGHAARSGTPGFQRRRSLGQPDRGAGPECLGAAIRGLNSQRAGSTPPPPSTAAAPRPTAARPCGMGRRRS